jgi:hypothetical protein
MVSGGSPTLIAAALARGAEAGRRVSLDVSAPVVDIVSVLVEAGASRWSSTPASTAASR